MEAVQDQLLPGGLACHGQCEGRGGGHLHHQLLRRGRSGERNFSFFFLQFLSFFGLLIEAIHFINYSQLHPSLT